VNPDVWVAFFITYMWESSWGDFRVGLPADSATKKRATPTRNGPRQNPPMGDHRRGVTGAFQITNQLDGCWLIPSVSPWLVESLYLFFTSPSPFISLHILIVVWMLIKDLRCNAYLVGGFNPPLWKIWVCQLGWWNSQYMESHKIPWFQTTNQS